MTSAKNKRKSRTSSGARKARKATRQRENDALHAEKVANGGLGRGERRRLANGVRKPV